MKLDLKQEVAKITNFVETTLRQQKHEKVVIGLSGGIDSTTTFYLLKKVLKPENIIIAHLYYFDSKINELNGLLEGIPNKNIHNLSIKNTVNELSDKLKIKTDKIRFGNVMARTRMIMLYDLAKKNNALVVGTEDKSEYLLGYYTRFGDQASDMEPILHLYKTQVYELAEYLGVPENILQKRPSPELWRNHSAEEELGFSYEEADPALSLYFDQKIPLEKINTNQFPNAKKVIGFAKKNSFKRYLPYKI